MRIRLWNTRGVVADFVSNRTTQADSCAHLLALSLLWACETYLGFFVTPVVTWTLAFEFAVVAVVTYTGVRACYVANGGNGASDFVLRFICLSLPIQVKLSLLGWTFVGLVYRFPDTFLDPTILPDPEHTWCFVTVAWVGLFSAMYCWRVWHRIDHLHSAQLGAAAGVAAPRG
jgi:hypothetical protein